MSEAGRGLSRGETLELEAGRVPGLVLSIDPATGKETPLMALPSHLTESLHNLTGDSSFGSRGTSALWDGERLAIYSNESIFRLGLGSERDAVVFE